MYGSNIMFADFEFSPNPYLIKIESVYDSQAVSSTVSGEGEFTGENAFSKYKFLKEIFLKGEAKWLRIPKVKPIFAKLMALDLIQNAKENMVSYSFRFEEVAEKYIKPDEISYAEIAEEKSLWDIERNYGVAVETLLELNPEIPDCYSVNKGGMIRIA